VEGGSLTRDFERQMEGCGNGMSLWNLCEQDVEGRLLYWRLKGMLNNDEEMVVFFHRVPILGNRGVLLSWNFEKRVRFFHQDNFYLGIQEADTRRLWKWATPRIWAPLGNLEWGCSFTVDLEIR
jgi:hypothetical protein